MKFYLSVLCAVGWLMFAPFYAGADDAHLSMDNTQSPPVNQDESGTSSGAEANCDNPALDLPSAMSPMTGKEKLFFYLKTPVELRSIAISMTSAGFRQAFDSVPEWGQGLEGYSKRFASGYGQKVVQQAIAFSMGYLMHEDPRYYKSESSGIWRRVFHAAGQTFIAHKDDGGIRPGYSYFTGMTSAVLISRQWHPENQQTAEKHLLSVAISLSTGIAKNIFLEFLPNGKKTTGR